MSSQGLSAFSALACQMWSRLHVMLHELANCDDVRQDYVSSEWDSGSKWFKHGQSVKLLASLLAQFSNLEKSLQPPWDQTIPTWEAQIQDGKTEQGWTRHTCKRHGERRASGWHLQICSNLTSMGMRFGTKKQEFPGVSWLKRGYLESWSPC